MYTQGKWEANKARTNWKITVRDEAGLTQVATVDGWTENAEDNAKLISAALEMRGVLQQVVRYCNQVEQAGGFVVNDGRNLIRKNAEKALARGSV